MSVPFNFSIAHHIMDNKDEHHLPSATHIVIGVNRKSRILWRLVMRNMCENGIFSGFSSICKPYRNTLLLLVEAESVHVQLVPVKTDVGMSPG